MRREVLNKIFLKIDLELLALVAELLMFVVHTQFMKLFYDDDRELFVRMILDFFFLLSTTGVS